ncbi:hypothetical protein D3C78_1056870 [compost metagenome]
MKAGFKGGVVVAAMALLAVSEVQAEELSANKQLASKINCMASYKVAEMIMADRQAGISLPDEMEHHKENEFLHSLIDKAYAEPLYNSEGYKERAIKAFAEAEYAQCKSLVKQALERE